MKRYWYIVPVTLLLGSIFFAMSETPAEYMGGEVAPSTVKYFAELDSQGFVQRIIVADQAFINSGAVGAPKNWVETTYDLTEVPAEIGGRYDKVNKGFIRSSDAKRGVTKADNAAFLAELREKNTNSTSTAP